MRRPRNDLVVAAFGARGSGKSHRVKEFLRRARPSRLLIWDTMDEYGEHARAVVSLGAMLAASSSRTFALRYVPRGTDKEIASRFGAFCAIAYERGELAMVVEELQRVTSPSWAPAEWSDCTLRGRHRRLALFGVSQRPASVDKNFFSNATHVYTGRLNFRDDVLCMANVLGVPVAAVAALRGHEQIGRDMLDGSLVEGRPGLERAPALPAMPPIEQKKLPKRAAR